MKTLLLGSITLLAITSGAHAASPAPLRPALSASLLGSGFRERAVAKRQLRTFFAQNPDAQAARKQAARFAPTAARWVGWAASPLLAYAGLSLGIADTSSLSSAVLLTAAPAVPFVGHWLGRVLDRRANTIGVDAGLKSGASVSQRVLYSWARARLIDVRAE